LSHTTWKAGLDEGQRDLVVQVVRRHDRDEVDALVGRQRQLVRQQVLPAAVVACVGQAEVAAGRARLVRLRRQRAGHQLDAAVERHRHAGAPLR
jgi:hypothetical protein